MKVYNTNLGPAVKINGMWFKWCPDMKMTSRTAWKDQKSIVVK